MKKIKSKLNSSSGKKVTKVISQNLKQNVTSSTQVRKDNAWLPR